jgi:hypothetical protein
LHGKAIFYKNGNKVMEGIWNPDFQDYYEEFGLLPTIEDKEIKDFIKNEWPN